MTALRPLWLAAAALLALPALAHQPDIPTDTPPDYKSECGSCHVAYLPALLSGSDWQDVMRHLDKHYGDNASLSENFRQLIEDFLVRNAEPHWKGHFPSGDPPRLTATLWYRAHHLELPDKIWSDKRVGSRSNCAACHPKAEDGRFNKQDLTEVPKSYEFDRDRRPGYMP